MFCTKCGKELKEGVSFCTQCGAPVEKETSAPAPSPVYTEPVYTQQQDIYNTQPVYNQQDVYNTQPVYTQQNEYDTQQNIYAQDPALGDTAGMPYVQEDYTGTQKKSGMGAGAKIAIAVVAALLVAAGAFIALIKLGYVDADKVLPSKIAALFGDNDEEEATEAEDTEETVQDQETQADTQAEEPAKEESAIETWAPVKDSDDDEMVTLDSSDKADVEEPAEEEPAREEETDEPEAAEEEITEPDYLFPDSSERELSESDLRNLSPWECRIARNEIYARHGRIFDDEELRAYFEGKSWYEGTIPANKFNENKYFNQIEKANAYFIDKYERKKGYK